MSGVRVQRLDHVHVYVTDRVAAEAWFADVIGLVRHDLPDAWAHPGGPVLLSSDGGETHIALFAAEPGSDKIGCNTIAFRIDGEGFMAFVERLDRTELKSPQGRRLKPRDVVDHGATLTVYFTDPDGNRFEVATYDHEQVRQRLAQAGASPVSAG
jgi:catechol 2,3-dioxygenase-like lactoylglutathione lyase family enzyme